MKTPKKAFYCGCKCNECANDVGCSKDCECLAIERDLMNLASSVPNTLTDQMAELIAEQQVSVEEIITGVIAPALASATTASELIYTAEDDVTTEPFTPQDDDEVWEGFCATGNDS